MRDPTASKEGGGEALEGRIRERVLLLEAANQRSVPVFGQGFIGLFWCFKVYSMLHYFLAHYSFYNEASNSVVYSLIFRPLSQF